MSMLLIAAASGLTYMDSGLPPRLSFFIAALLGVIAANIALLTAYLLVKLLLRNGPVYIICLAALSAGLAGLIYAACNGKVTMPVAACASVIAVWSLFSLGRSLWALL